MHKAVIEILRGKEYKIIEEFEILEREAVYKKIPKFLFDSRAFSLVNKEGCRKGELWSHQSIALEKINAGKNVVVSTGTASGKSLIFRTASFHRTLLDKNQRVIVFYPLKALAADQLISWKKAAKDMKLPDSYVEKIDGNVDFKRREEILKTSKIVLMTPDVCHAWMMSNMASKFVRNFLMNLDLIVLDEAHTLEGVFGSNFSFLFRRLLVARNNLISKEERKKEISVIAATATISNPSEHLNALTGLDYDEVGNDVDGSLQYKSICMHVMPKDGQEIETAKLLHVELLKNSNEGGFITFVDSRKGVEILASATNKKLKDESIDDEVLPYRAGFAAEDRANIERGLKSGKLRGVVSTSALEVGIDLPHLQVGINVGVPASRKSYRQRLGRVGRSGPGVFIVLAEENAFIKFGTTFKQYYEMSVEPSYLYLNNRFMQFAHANCLVDELESVGARDRTVLPARVHWPEGFDDVFKIARPGGGRPEEFDAIAQMGGDVPQRNYPLRNIGETNFKITIGDNGEIGEASLSQALRECYPGATYYHMAKPYKVVKWDTAGFQSSIKVRVVTAAQTTKPRIRTWIEAGVTAIGLVDNHYRKGEKGFIAECQMQITERVEGYGDGDNKFIPYSERRENNPNMRSKTRQFRTTGVIISIDDDWFSQAKNKFFVAEKIKEIFVREFSILQQDVGMSATNISLMTHASNQTCTTCIVIFDQTYGSLRLTERIYSDIVSMIDRMKVAAGTVQEDEREQYKTAINCLVEFTESLEIESEIQTGNESVITDNNGLLQVYAAGSRVGKRDEGALYTSVKIIMPALLEGKLMYQVECPPKSAMAAPAKMFVSPEYLEPLAGDDEWSYESWDPVTQEYEKEDVNEIDGGVIDDEDIEEIIVPDSIGMDSHKNEQFNIREVTYIPRSGLSYKGTYSSDMNAIVLLPVTAIEVIPGKSTMGLYDYNTAEITLVEVE